MKGICHDCDKICNEDKIVMIGENSGWGYGVVNILCEDCYNKRIEEKRQEEINRNKPLPLKEKILFGIGISLFILLLVLIIFDIHW